MITVLIDGQSGAGKTTLAGELAARTGFQLVHLDDFYPGWTGLEAASNIVACHVLDADNPGFFTWDWHNNCQSDWVSLEPGRSLIIEGCGSITAATKRKASLLGEVVTVRITGPEALRKQRALNRDPDYAPFWKVWAQQEQRHFSLGVEVDHEIVLGSDEASGRPEEIYDSLGTAQSS